MYVMIRHLTMYELMKYVCHDRTFWLCMIIMIEYVCHDKTF